MIIKKRPDEEARARLLGDALIKEFKFKRVIHTDVLRLCPRRGDFTVWYAGYDVPTPRSAPLLLPLGSPDNLKLQARIHIGWAYCRVCHKVHSTAKYGLLVTATDVDGTTYSKELPFDEVEDFYLSSF